SPESPFAPVNSRSAYRFGTPYTLDGTSGAFRTGRRCRIPYARPSESRRWFLETAECSVATLWCCRTTSVCSSFLARASPKSGRFEKITYFLNYTILSRFCYTVAVALADSWQTHLAFRFCLPTNWPRKLRISKHEEHICRQPQFWGNGSIRPLPV